MYAKLYSSLLTSSLWAEDAETRLTWITFLAAADRDGFVFGSPVGMANLARVSAAGARRAIEKFLSPDPDSSDSMRNPEFEGRRLESVDGGWRILNYGYYRSLQRAEDRRAQYAESKRKTRAGNVDSPQMSRDVSGSPPSEAEAEAEANTKNRETGVPPAPAAPKKRPFEPPNQETVRAYFAERGWPKREADGFFAFYTSKGWMVGKNRMQVWKASAALWMNRRQEDTK